MAKPRPDEKMPDGKGNRGGGGVCSGCGGAGGRYVTQPISRGGKIEKQDTWQACGSCGGSGRSR